MLRAIPHGFAEIVNTYGDPRPFLADGDDTDWQREILTPIELPFSLALSWDRTVRVRRLRVHKLAADNFSAAFAALYANGLDDLVTELGGVYSARMQRGSDSRLSLHTWGAAIDLNPRTNMLGTKGDMSPDVVGIFSRYGFAWGGKFSRSDPQHFQLATGY